MKKLVHKELSYTITGICFAVAKKLGRFCKEKQYADCFEEELINSKIPYRREIKLRQINPISPSGNQADFLIEGKVLVDAKAKKFVTKEDYYQMQRYLMACNVELGLIVNFRNTTIKPRRVLNSGYSDADSGHSGRSRGFTLVEMIVSFAVFAIIMVVSVGSVLSLMQANYKAQSLKTVVDNLHFALENISRNLRTGRAYHCDAAAGDVRSPADCANDPASSVAVSVRGGEVFVYRLRAGAIERSTDGGTTFFPITAPEITVEQLQFFVDGSSPADSRQPRVLIVGSGSMQGRGKALSRFEVETLVSQRLLDVGE